MDSIVSARVYEGFHNLINTICLNAEIAKTGSCPDRTERPYEGPTYTGFVQIIGSASYEPEDGDGYVDTRYKTTDFLGYLTVEETKDRLTLAYITQTWSAAIKETILEDGRIEQVQLLDNLGNIVAFADAVYSLSGMSLKWNHCDDLTLEAIDAMERQAHAESRDAIRSDSFHSASLADEKAARAAAMRSVIINLPRVATRRI